MKKILVFLIGSAVIAEVFGGFVIIAYFLKWVAEGG